MATYTNGEQVVSTRTKMNDTLLNNFGVSFPSNSLGTVHPLRDDTVRVEIIVDSILIQPSNLFLGGSFDGTNFFYIEADNNDHTSGSLNTYAPRMVSSFEAPIKSTYANPEYYQTYKLSYPPPFLRFFNQ